MADTREKILNTALQLFARDGYEAVSVSDIAGALGITKGALYRHYQNKRDIFDSIVRRMEERDRQQAAEHGVPEGTAEEMPGTYEAADPQNTLAFSKAMFRYWTEDEFA
ncbi:MAG: helix-turn-helix transcriptional regulator, partial [Firmicutes bacterium]|nr:helix-turn-helix transcriptional regulator [Bacillota bacterium]